MKNLVSKRVLQVLNIVSVIFAIAANAVVATSPSLPAIGAVSDQLNTLLTPATYAFSIWTLIFIMIALLALYQARDFCSEQKSNVLPAKLSGWFILANLMNGLWSYTFVSGATALSVLILLTLVISLGMLIRNFDIAHGDVSGGTILFVWWPILLYAGWTLVASVVNVAAFLESIGVYLAAQTAALVIIGLFGFLSVLLWRRNVRALVLASAWGIAAIAVAQNVAAPLVAGTATIAAGGLLLQTFYHAWLDRAASPVEKITTSVARYLARSRQR